MWKVLYDNPKLVYPLVGLLVCLILYVPVSATFRLLSNYKTLEGKIRNFSKGEIVAKQARANENLILKEGTQARTIFEALSLSCKEHSILITEVNPPLHMQMDQVGIQIEQVTLEGDFTDLLRSLDDIKENLFPTKIASVRFNRVENNKQVKLLAHITFQSVKLPNNEN